MILALVLLIGLCGGGAAVLLHRRQVKLAQAITAIGGVVTLLLADSARQMDAEESHDLALAIRAVEMTLGINPQGGFGSVAARLNQCLPGTGEETP